MDVEMKVDDSDLSTFVSQLNKEQQPDFTIFVGEYSWKVHGRRLSKSSKFFEKLCEAESHDTANRTIMLGDDDPLLVAYLIRWFYKGEYYDPGDDGQEDDDDDEAAKLSIHKIMDSGRNVLADGDALSVPEPKALHAMMYMAADKYGISQLKGLAVTEIETQLSWDKDAFLPTLEHLLAPLPPTPASASSLLSTSNSTTCVSISGTPTPAALSSTTESPATTPDEVPNADATPATSPSAATDAEARAIAVNQNGNVDENAGPCTNTTPAPTTGTSVNSRPAHRSINPDNDPTLWTVLVRAASSSILEYRDNDTFGQIMLGNALFQWAVLRQVASRLAEMSEECKKLNDTVDTIQPKKKRKTPAKKAGTAEPDEGGKKVATETKEKEKTLAKGKTSAAKAKGGKHASQASS
ncbi:hypothetical protein LTR20_009514 [Exophiala xenobiotica]|nr:hypothetical protein LTS13_008530 [Exophiala xenobiotica]KAK5392399.1 hypothetical protein LTR79_010372 [Exophiala xenobiotica]KAK5408710.1 hypothetical protein LTR90_009327 [Exophiala xenobiotica]KAK5455609.1 hypothetical protein LTR20_009514 [Exophiala xenobiotica]KAK5473931.1 hypothetical protein LTR26_009934 [Exophiala xenobiotica]